MRISIIIFTISTFLIFTVTSCKDTKTERTKEHNHNDNKIAGQETFNVTGISKNEKANTLTNAQNNTATIVIKANKALEYKFKISQNEKLEYEWISNAPIPYDFHGDPEDKDSYPKGYFKSYDKGTSNTAKGNITIPFKGSHGWYWKNTSAKDITITLTTKGNYNIIGVIQ